jgi:hypothetical protein
VLRISHDAALAPGNQWRGVLLHGHRIRGCKQILLLLSQLEGLLRLGEGLVGVQRDILLLLHGSQSSIVGVAGSELRARRGRQDHALDGGGGATWHTLGLIV